MASWNEFVEELDATMVVTPASGPGRKRLFLSSSGVWKCVDHLGNISLLSTVYVMAIHNPVIEYADSPYSAVINETVKALTDAGDAGDIVVELPTAVGFAGQMVKIISVTPPYSGVLPAGRRVRINAFGGELINGDPFKELTNAGENLNLESDGANWIITG